MTAAWLSGYGHSERWEPARVVFLGDLVHLGKPSDPERNAIEAVLASVGERSAMTVVLGNHDRHFESDFSAASASP